MALVNGVAVHSVLFEDINFTSVDHPGAPIVPAALATAEEMGATVPELVRAIILGYETHLAIGAVAADGVRARGFRTTSVFGTVGAAAAVGLLSGLSEAQYSVALRLAANFCSVPLRDLRKARRSRFCRQVWLPLSECWRCGWLAQARVCLVGNI